MENLWNVSTLGSDSSVIRIVSTLLYEVKVLDVRPSHTEFSTPEEGRDCGHMAGIYSIASDDQKRRAGRVVTPLTTSWLIDRCLVVC
jgi:hypothetical protein